MDQRIKLSNEEKHLLIAIKRFESIFIDFENDKKALEFLLKQFALPKSVYDRPLRKSEAIELMKYLDRKDLIDTIQNLTIPVFTINLKIINELKIFDSERKLMVSFENFSKNKKIRLSALLLDLKLKWIDSNFKMSDEDILGLVNEDYVLKFQNKNQKIKKK